MKICGHELDVALGDLRQLIIRIAFGPEHESGGDDWLGGLEARAVSVCSLADLA